MKSEFCKEDKNQAMRDLASILTSGDTIYTVLRHVSKSGMYRAIDCYVMKDNEPWRITWQVSVALNMRYDKKYEATGVSGCGMDMGFHIVNSLEYAMQYKFKHRWL